MPDTDTVTLEPPPTPEAQEQAITAVQAAFDRAAPLKGKKAEKPIVEKLKEEVKPEPAKVVEASPAEPVKEPEAKKEELKLPSFITTDKPKEEVKTEPEVRLEDLPKEAPEGSDPKVKIQWDKARKLIDAQEVELKALRSKQGEKQGEGKELSQVDTARLKQLEDENAQYKGQLQRFGLEQHPDFIQRVIRPLQSTYSEAKRIIKDAGGNPESLDRALMATGKAHYDAMDEILAELPESAKGELNSAMRDYRKLAQARSDAVANAPRALEELHKRDTQNQKQYLEIQKADMVKLFDSRVNYLRDEAKLETLMETQEEGATWWNEIPKKVLKTARMIALENQDMEVVMDASILAASAMSFRDMYQKERKDRLKAEKELAEVKGSEPVVSDAGSHAVVTKDEELRKLPIGAAFLKVLQEQE